VVASSIVMNLQTLRSRTVNPLKGAVVTVGVDPRGHQAQHHFRPGRHAADRPRR
jgi:metal-dependent amidase/aminoacylase/carboxypeptidase family protein